MIQITQEILDLSVQEVDTIFTQLLSQVSEEEKTLLSDDMISLQREYERERDMISLDLLK